MTQIGIVGHTAFHASAELDNNNAGFHNSLYRGKNLGNAVSADQWAQIAAGTFDDMFIGDYWKITYNNTERIFRIAGFDYWYNTGDDYNASSNPDGIKCQTHHVVIVPDASLVSAKMNNDNDTTGAYIGSGFYTGENHDQSANTAKATANGIIEGSFGASHILTKREYLANAITNGYETTRAWYTSTWELMNEIMVYGCEVFHNKAHGTNVPRSNDVCKSQLPLFRLRHDLICNRANWWLRDVVAASSFAFVTNTGYSNYSNASNSIGVRPAFGIVA